MSIINTDSEHSSLIQVRTADGTAGWVSRGDLRLKCERIKRAADRTLRADGSSGVGNSGWRPMFFMQMADSQLGMAQTFAASDMGNAMPPGWANEEAMLKKAIAEINRLRPAFAIVCGDLINAYPGEDGSESSERNAQTFDFQMACEAVDPTIPLVCVCGNHDVGNRPTPASIRSFTRSFGDDYFSFLVDGTRHRHRQHLHTLCSLSHSLSDTSVRLSVRAGCKCIVLNSQLFKDSSGCPGFQTEQWTWLKEELANEETRSAKHVLCFCHIPPFLFDADEPDAYFNFERQTRGELLSLLAQYNVKACFCGHYHRNAGGMYKDASNGNTVEVITTAACGTNIANAVGKNVLELEGIGTCTEVDEDVSGLRIVRVGEEGVAHDWYTFRQLASVTQEEALEGSSSSSSSASAATEPPSKRRKADNGE